MECKRSHGDACDPLDDSSTKSTRELVCDFLIVSLRPYGSLVPAQRLMCVLLRVCEPRVNRLTSPGHSVERRQKGGPRPVLSFLSSCTSTYDFARIYPGQKAWKANKTNQTRFAYQSKGGWQQIVNSSLHVRNKQPLTKSPIASVIVTACNGAYW